MKKNTDLALLILRITIGVLMLLHGIGKLEHGLGFIKGLLNNHNLPTFIAYGALVGEVLAPLAMIIGFRTRIAAAIFAFNCMMAVALTQSQLVFQLNDHGAWAIELLGLYFLAAVALIFSGAGKYAVSQESIWD